MGDKMDGVTQDKWGIDASQYPVPIETYVFLLIAKLHANSRAGSG